MSKNLPKEQRKSLANWRTFYVLFQWPFILLGLLVGFIVEGLSLGYVSSKHLTKMVEEWL